MFIHAKKKQKTLPKTKEWFSEVLAGALRRHFGNAASIRDVNDTFFVTFIPTGITVAIGKDRVWEKFAGMDTTDPRFEWDAYVVAEDVSDDAQNALCREILLASIRKLSCPSGNQSLPSSSFETSIIRVVKSA